MTAADPQGLEAENDVLRRSVARLERRVASLDRMLERLDKMLVASDAVSASLLREQARFTEEIESHQRALESALGRIRDDLADAQVFQEALLPELPAHPGIELAAAYRPADEVGGDLYDVVLKDGRLRIFMGDTTGHGVQAALRTMVVRSFLARHQSASSPARLLEALNDDLVAAYGRLVRVAACCAEVDLRADPPRLSYANAGAPPLLLAEHGQVSEVYTQGAFLGIVGDETWADVERELPPGARLFAYTDGLFDQWNGDGDLLDEARVVAELASESATLSEAVGAAVRVGAEFRGRSPQADDLALLGLAMTTSGLRPGG